MRKCVPIGSGAAITEDAGNNMKEQTSSPLPAVESNEADLAVLDVQGFSSLAHIPKATILTLRSRSPDKLPPPFRLRPLRWRVQTVVRWMEKQEQHELERIERVFRHA